MKKFKQYLREDIAIFKPAKDLKSPKYKKIKIFKEGWQKIQLPTPVPPETEIEKLISICHSATEQDKKERRERSDMRASVRLVRHIALLLLSGLFSVRGGGGLETSIGNREDVGYTQTKTYT